tara:strand:- start:912 stop:1214 length:303 start_codon:yes stop_codon:yes gene_type:complete
MTDLEKWDRAKTLLLESLYKPDDRLRGCAFNQGCKDELMAMRDEVIEIVRSMKNPHTPPLEFGKKNNHVEPTVNTPHGDISETLMSGALGAYYMSDQREY